MLFKEMNARKQVLQMNDLILDKNIKIQGTKFDRKRKYDEKTIKQMKQLYISGVKPSEIAKKFNSSSFMVKYICDYTFKTLHNLKRDGKHTGVNHITSTDRASYKRNLVKNKEIKVAGVIYG